MRNWRILLALLLALALALAACAGDEEAGDPTAATDDTDDADDADDADEADDADDTADDEAEGDEAEIVEEDDQVGVEADSADLLGAGATFITPLMLEWIRDNEPGINVNYQSIGSGGGIEQFLSENVDFGSSEAHLDDEAMEEAREIRGCEPIHFVDAFGSVTVAYNDPDLDAALEAAGQDNVILDAEAIAGIYNTDITTWDDPAIAELNPDVELPATSLVAVHRSDGSGTTNIFTQFLDDAADNWELGFGTEVDWAAGTIGGNGNEGVAAETQQQPGAVGYLSYAYAVENDIPVASVVNEDGTPIAPTLEAISAGPSEILDDIPEDQRFAVLGVGGEGYPIVGPHWILAWECGYDDDVAESMKEFFTWAVTEGDDLATDLFYAPVTGDFEQRVLDQIDRINSEE
ncbi:MAG: phosphate ABC transporter substrate-binding protein PstS [Egibacteraceae bacterium]